MFYYPPTQFSLAMQASRDLNADAELQALIDERFADINELRMRIGDEVASNYACGAGSGIEKDESIAYVTLPIANLAVMTYAERDGGMGEYEIDLQIAMEKVAEYLRQNAPKLSELQQQGVAIALKVGISLTPVNKIAFDVNGQLAETCAQLQLPLRVCAENEK